MSAADSDLFEVKNWDKFQHYKDRNPPWIKLHFEMLSSPDWVMLADASRVLMIACMLIASRNEGRVPNNPEYIRRVAYLNKTPDLTPLISSGFLVPSSTCKRMLADARPETETETETEERRDRSTIPIGIVCAAPSTKATAPKDPAEVLLTFDCCGNPREFHLTREKLTEYHHLYGEALNVLKEAKAARQWLIDNTTRRKTAKGIPRFLNGWMRRAVDSGKGASPVSHEEFEQQRDRMLAAKRADEAQAARARAANTRGNGNHDDPQVTVLQAMEILP